MNQEGKTIKSIDLCVSNIDKLAGGRSSGAKSAGAPDVPQSSSDGEDGSSDDEETNDISLDDIF